MNNLDIRVGFGYDVHSFTKNRKFILGGVEINYKLGLKGHSDADVLLHSLCDALLGAAGFKDIGHQFPDTDDKYKNISSLILLKESFKLVKSNGWKVNNSDSVVVLEEPKIFKYIEKIKNNISEILETQNISIKATTSEGLGFVGKKKGCISYSTVLISK